MTAGFFSLRKDELRLLHVAMISGSIPGAGDLRCEILAEAGLLKSLPPKGPIPPNLLYVRTWKEGGKRYQNALLNTYQITLKGRLCLLSARRRFW